jgi:hypothetical protein
MSINSSVQQLAAGVAASASGHVLSQASDGRILHFPTIGIISVICAVVCIPLARFLRTPEPATAVISAVPAEG